MSDTTSTIDAEPQSVSELTGTLSQVAREATEAAPAPEPAAPVVGDELEPELLDEIDEPALEGSPEVPADEAPAVVDAFAELGVDRATIEQALQLHKATQTEDGVIQLFLEAGKQLGLGLDKIEALFGAAPPTAEGDEDYDYDKDPDRPVTLKEIQALERQRQEAFRQAQQQTQIEQARNAASVTVQDTVKALGLTMEDEATKVILSLGNEYLPNGSLDPAAIKAAVERGHADYTALVEKERKAYIASKRKAATTVPTAPAGGAAPSTAEPAEPVDTAEAIKRARAMFREQGVLR